MHTSIGQKTDALELQQAFGKEAFQMARSVVRWEPAGDMVSMRDAMDRFFGRSFQDWFYRPLEPLSLLSDGSLALDVYETDDSLVVKADMPGVKAEDIDVSVTENVLNIHAQMKEENEVKRENFLRSERRFGEYRRSVALPGNLQTDKAQANYADGTLTLTFPKSEETKPKAIKVEAK
jgi:HSP20 family protein